MAPSREINTWYPIPKWKVFFGANKNRKEYSEPYFNKQDSRRTDANIYDNDFSPTQFLKKRFEISERLNIQFFPVKDGNITVKKFERKINDNATEQVALFVIYAHTRSKGIARMQNNSDTEAVSEESLSELMKGNDNISIMCDGSGVCMENITFVDMEKFLNTNKNGNETFPESFEVVSIPVTKSMSIEMNIGELGGNNYTAVIMPVNGNLTSKVMKYEELVTSGEDIIKMPLSENMNIIIDSTEYINFTEKSMNKTTNVSEVVKEMNTETTLTGNNLSEENYEIDGKILETGLNMSNYFTENVLNNTTYARNFKLERLLDEDQNFYNDNSVRNESVVDNLIYVTEYLDFALDNTTHLEYNNLSDVDNTTENRNLYDINTEDEQRLVNLTTNNTDSQLYSYPFIYEYSKKFGPYEVKELNNYHSPFIATIHLTVKNKFKSNDSDNNETLINKENISNTFESSFQNESSGDIQKSYSLNFARTKRYAYNNGNSTRWQKLLDENEKRKTIKPEITNNKRFLNENEISNNYQHGLKRIILEEGKVLSPIWRGMNYYSSILEGRNTKGEQSYSSREESYSSSTLSNSNEEFNPKSSNKFRNKILIANEISDKILGSDGANSNQTVYMGRSKRKVAFLTLIPNKDTVVNNTKKSALQIVGKASLDKYSDLWKRKISSEGQSLGKNNVKIRKICDFQDDCSGINDVFNAMKVTVSEYKKGYQIRGRNLDGNESSKANKDIDKRIDFRSSNLTGEMTDRKFIPKNVRKQHESDLKGYESAIKLTFGTKTRNDFKEKENSNSDVMESFGTDLESKTEQNNKRNNALLWNQFKETKKATRSAGGKKEFQKLHINSLNEYSFIPRKLTRDKRSSSRIPLALHDRHEGLYSKDANESPYKIPFQDFKVTNYSSSPTSDIRSDELEWQKFLLNMFQTTALNSRIKSTKSTNVNSENIHPQNRIKEWLRRGSVWPQEKEPIKHVNEHILKNKLVPGYNWEIIIPETVEPFVPIPMKRKLPRDPVNNKRIETDTTHEHPEREREDDDNTQWVTVNYTPHLKEQNKWKQNTTISPRKDNKPRKIVPTSVRKPNLMSTRRPWSPDQHWNSNQWMSHNVWNPILMDPIQWMEHNVWNPIQWISHNAWNPMRMMGGMAGGD